MTVWLCDSFQNRTQKKSCAPLPNTLWTMSSCVPSGSGLPSSCISGTKEKPNSFFSPFSFAAGAETTVLTWNESIMGKSTISEGGIISGRKINLKEKSVSEVNNAVLLEQCLSSKRKCVPRNISRGMGSLICSAQRGLLLWYRT